MTPEKVLLFDQANLENFKIPLAQLADKGLLVAKSAPGTYQLTDAGFDAMKQGK